MNKREGDNRAANEPHSPIAFIGPGERMSYILSPVMSFAIAEYDQKGKDVLVATDTRWVCGTVGNYSIQSDDGLKNIDLNSETAIAFTGHAEVMARIMSKLYDDPSLFSTPYTDVLRRLETKPHKLILSSREIVERLDYITPKALAFCGTDLGCSMILAGRFELELVMYWWAEENKWRGTPNRYSQNRRVRTFPKEITMGGAIQRRADQILDGHGCAAARIRRVIQFLSNHESVMSVGGNCIIRRYSKGFTLSPRNSPRRDP